MASKYIDVSAVMQIIGSVYNNPSLLDRTDKYVINEEDFTEDFHRIVFGSIYKLHELGAKKIDLKSIADFLSSRPKSEAIYKDKGEEWLLKVSENAEPLAFDYYYSRLKKMTLLRTYDNFGIDVSEIYDPDNVFDLKKKQAQEDFIDNSSLEDLALKIDDKIERIKLKCISNVKNNSFKAGHNIFSLIQKYKEAPEVGVPLYGSMINTVTRGARLKKLYLRSAPSGYGKTRTMIADTCTIGASQIYDNIYGWIKTGKAMPTVYITTEQTVDEIQTMMLAFLSNVNEEKILNGSYSNDEETRVLQAATILQDSPIYIEELLDFSMQDVEDIIKKNIRENNASYVFFDYIQTSPKILQEITSKSGGVRLREDNILFMLSAKLKDLANENGVFILTSTQLNGSWTEADTPDQNMLRGAKSIADRIDLGMIQLPAKEKDYQALETILKTEAFQRPNFKISIYKNRRGKYKGVYLWAVADLGTCRMNPIFATTWDYEILSVEDLKIIINDEEE